MSAYCLPATSTPRPHGSRQVITASSRGRRHLPRQPASSRTIYGGGVDSLVDLILAVGPRLTETRRSADVRLLTSVSQSCRTRTASILLSSYGSHHNGAIRRSRCLSVPHRSSKTALLELWLQNASGKPRTGTGIHRSAWPHGNVIQAEGHSIHFW